MTNEEAYKRIANIVFKYEEKELSSLDDRKLNNEALNHIREALKNEKPQGEWVEKVERRGCFAGDKTVYSYTCPFCGVKEFKKYPFCHCGADMRGEGK